MERTVRAAVGAVAVVVVTALGASPATAAGLSTLALYDMNEPSGATQLVDSSGNGINGTIGAHVGLDGEIHNFPFHKGWKGGTVDPEHQDLVASDALNPGTRDFSVSLRLKLRHDIGNVLQKGQSGTIGGMFALKLDEGDGKILCQYRSPTGSGSVWSPNAIDDGAFHVVTCTRTAGLVTVTVDGTQTASVKHATGDITNSMPLSIGGKSKCQAVPGFDCDYFDGQIDWLRISAPARPGVPYISPGKARPRTFYPYRRDGFRDRVGFRFRAGLRTPIQGGADIRVEIWNASRTRLVRTWTFQDADAQLRIYRVRWAGRRHSGRMVKPGIYRIRATIRVPNAPGEGTHQTRWRTIRARRGG
jgi:hypothetical protein